MASKINYLDCNQDRFGTGVLSCEIQTGVPYGFFLADKSWRLDPTQDDFDAEYIEKQIKAKMLIPFLNPIGFEPQNEEAEIFTSNLKVQLKVMDGLPGFAFDYSKGRGFHKAAYSYNSVGNYDVLIAYNNGVVDGAITPDGKIKGYNAGMIDTAMFQASNGTDPQKTTIAFQLTDALEFNTKYALLSGEANGFSLSAIGGVIDVNLKKISNADEKVVISANMTNNAAITLLGLAVADFAVEGTSATISAVSYNDQLKQYEVEFNGTVAPDYADLRIFLHDSTSLGYDVIKKGVTLYQGSTR